MLKGSNSHHNILTMPRIKLREYLAMQISLHKQAEGMVSASQSNDKWLKKVKSSQEIRKSRPDDLEEEQNSHYDNSNSLVLNFEEGNHDSLNLMVKPNFQTIQYDRKNPFNGT